MPRLFRAKLRHRSPSPPVSDLRIELETRDEQTAREVIRDNFGHMEIIKLCDMGNINQATSDWRHDT